MARWMVGKGAKNIVLVSRSGSATGKVKALIDEVAATGANIVVRRCDVADITSVENLIATGFADMPEVRGVVHGAMVLRVSSQPFPPEQTPFPPEQTLISTGRLIRENDA
jgi:hypothetical protein